LLHFILRILLNASAFVYVFPMLKGLQFHGDFFIACAFGIFFSIVLSIIEVIAAFLSTVWTLSTFGLALLILIPLRLFCFWLLPTLVLFLIAHIFPNIFSIQNYISATWAAVILVAIGIITRDRKN
jgi:uncharacterized membrane protein YvlD (DUF360 family)